MQQLALSNQWHWFSTFSPVVHICNNLCLWQNKPLWWGVRTILAFEYKGNRLELYWFRRIGKVYSGGHKFPLTEWILSPFRQLFLIYLIVFCCSSLCDYRDKEDIRVFAPCPFFFAVCRENKFWINSTRSFLCTKEMKEMKSRQKHISHPSDMSLWA